MLGRLARIGLSSPGGLGGAFVPWARTPKGAMSPIKQAIIIPRFIRISFFGLFGMVILFVFVRPE
jgi:hypothetical protein